MRAQSRRLPFTRSLVGLALIVAGFMWVHSVRAEEPHKRVLILHSTRRDTQISIVLDREVPRLLDARLGQGQDYYAEYIDAARFPDPEYQLAFRDFLRLKYKGQSFDVVIAMMDVAAEFVERHRDELFPESPVVFFTNTPRRRLPNSTGVVAPLNLSSTIVLAAALQPDLKHVFVVSGAGPREQANERLARSQLQRLQTRLEITYLSGLPTRELEARLSTLPPHSIVYFLLVYRDGAGQNFHPLEYLDRVAAIANAPTYCWVDSAIGRGVVGGSLLNQMGQAEAVSALTLRVLAGERADAIPVSAPDLVVNQVDWRQLQRWGISEARIPARTAVRFRSPSVWDRYKGYIIGASSVLIVQAALIAGLLIQASRRRQAEKRLVASQTQLRASYARISDLGQRLLLAQESERSRIARELHDDVSQQIALLSIDLQTLGGPARPQRGPDRRGVNELMGRVDSLAKSVHDLSYRLYPEKLRLLGLVAAIKGLQRDLCQPEVDIIFTHDIGSTPLPHDVTLCLFRVVQESLTNALKHSGASRIFVHLARSQDRLTLTITDDGRGFDVDAAYGKGLGLISMKERLEALRGTLTIRSAPGAGTRAEAVLVLEAATAVAV